MKRLRAAALWAATPILILASLGLASLVPASRASAHGRLPALGQLAFFPDDPDRIVARSTFGLILSEDGGRSWRWICSVMMGIDPTVEDPRIALVPPLEGAERAILAGTFEGLVRGEGGCRWGFPDEALVGRYIIDVHREAADPSRVWALHSEGGVPDRIFRSADGGRSFAEFGPEISEMLIERIQVAPSDPLRVYVSGARPALSAGEMTRAFLWVSEDGGGSYEAREIALLEGERNLFVLAVDPLDPDRLFARVRRRRGAPEDPLERLVRSVDGGRSWETVLELPEITDVALSEDGRGVWVASQSAGGLHRSLDGGDLFEALQPGLNARCLGRNAGVLYVCGDGYSDGFALARSEDGGESLEPILRYSDLGLIWGCGECAEVSYVCAQWLPDLAFDLRLDAGIGGLTDGAITGTPRDAARPSYCLPDGRVLDAGPPPVPGMDAGPGSPEAPGNCGCRLAPSPRPAGGWALALALAWLRWRMRRRRV